MLHELGWHLHDECVGLALEAVFVADSVVHGCGQGPGGRVERAYPETGKTLGESALERSPPISMLAWQAADLGSLKGLILGSVTVYLSQKTAVYRQKYRHQIVDLARFADTPVDS